MLKSHFVAIQFYLFGDEKKAEIIRQVLLALVDLHRKGKEITERDVLYAIKMNEQHRLANFNHFLMGKLVIKVDQRASKKIYAKTFNQKDYYRKIQTDNFIF